MDKLFKDLNQHEKAFKAERKLSEMLHQVCFPTTSIYNHTIEVNIIQQELTKVSPTAQAYYIKQFKKRGIRIGKRT